VDTNLDATDTKVLTVSSVTPTTLLGNFLTSLENLKGQPYASQLNHKTRSTSLTHWPLGGYGKLAQLQRLSFSVGLVQTPGRGNRAGHHQFDITSKGNSSAPRR